MTKIDGIKDVPNLMIFCATNRLHMMDEAFLRRMSGKFFVGRPSSQARIKILAQIPKFALEPNIIDLLAIATTNFSGAAVGALKSNIIVAMDQHQNSEMLTNRALLELADKTAKEFGCWGRSVQRSLARPWKCSLLDV